MKTVKYTFLKSSGIYILQSTESVSLPKNIQSCKWHVQENDIYGFKQMFNNPENKKGH